MIKQLTELLFRKGYHYFDNNERNVLVKESDDSVFLLLLNVYRKGDDKRNYEYFRQNTEYKVVTGYKKKVNTLHIIINPDGMFDDGLIEIASSLPDVWLLAADTGRIYIYENQPEQFDDLHDYIESGLFRVNKNLMQEIGFKFTPVNCVIVIINVAAFIAVILLNGGIYSVYDSEVMLKMGASSYNSFASGRWYEVITSMFLHFGIMHLFNNMLLLTYVGCELEKRIGALTYFFLYMGSGVCGNLVSLWYYSRIGEVDIVSAGASGAVFGVIGGLIVYLIFSKEKDDYLTPKRLVFMSFMTLYYGITAAGVDNAAHIGGFCFGIIGGFLLSKILRYDKIESTDL